MRRGAGLGQRDSARARRRPGLAWLAVPCSAAPAAVDEQAVDGIWHAVQSRAHGRQAAERLPPFLIVEADLEQKCPSGPHAMPRRRRHWSALPRSVQSRAVPATGKPRTRRAVPRSTTIQPLWRWYVLLLDTGAPHRAGLSARAIINSLHSGVSFRRAVLLGWCSSSCRETRGAGGAGPRMPSCPCPGS